MIIPTCKFLTFVYQGIALVWYRKAPTQKRFCVDYHFESFKFTVILFGSMLPNLKGHDEARVAETRYGPSLFSFICSLLLKDRSFISICYFSAGVVP